MRVLFISNEAELGGAPQSLIELFLTLRNNKNVTPIVLTPKKGFVYTVCRKEKIPVYVVPYNSVMIGDSTELVKKIAKRILIPVYNINHYFHTKRSIQKIGDIINKEKIDLVHTNIERDDIGMIIGEKYNIPNIVHIREFGDLDYHCIVLKRHYIDFINRYATRSIAISKAVKTHWTNKGLNSHNCNQVYNGVNIQNIIKCKRKIDKNKIKFVMVGNFLDSKGQIKAIRSIGKLPDRLKKKVDFDLYGTGSKAYIQRIYRTIKEYGLEAHVHLKGYSRNLYNLYKDYDIGLMCSEYEGFGRVTIEYMAAGLCVVASNSGANPEIITNEIDGILYEKETDGSLSEKIEKLIDNPDLIRQISLKAVKRAAYFSKEKNADEIYELYKNLLYKKG